MNIIYANESNKASVICPQCGFLKIIDLTHIKNTQKRAKAKCKCGEVSQFTFEYRKNYRKKVRLAGEYHVKGTKEKGEIIIRDISLVGIRFESLSPCHFSTGDILEVKFRLDNPTRSEICKQYTVEWVMDHMVGAHYSNPHFCDSELGFYLRS